MLRQRAAIGLLGIQEPDLESFRVLAQSCLGDLMVMERDEEAFPQSNLSNFRAMLPL